MAEKKRFSNNINIQNRKVRYEYELLDKYVAGMVLKGTEIKSIREGKVNLMESYCLFDKGELWVRQLYISPYSLGTDNNHEEARDRKLLLSKKELAKLKKRKEEKALTIVPTKLFINDRGLAKLEIALAKGKKLHDKRESIKKKDVNREVEGY